MSYKKSVVILNPELFKEQLSLRTEIHNSNKNAYWEGDIYGNRFFLERRMNVFGPHKPRIIGRIEVEKGREVLYLSVRPRSLFTGGLLAMIILSINGVITLNLNLVFFHR